MKFLTCVISIVVYVLGTFNLDRDIYKVALCSKGEVPTKLKNKIIIEIVMMIISLIILFILQGKSYSFLY